MGRSPCINRPSREKRLRSLLAARRNFCAA